MIDVIGALICGIALGFYEGYIYASEQQIGFPGFLEWIGIKKDGKIIEVKKLESE
jgi:hypothetical protein